MTQLALLLVIALLGSAVTFVLGKLELTRSPVPATVQRAEGALERASWSLLRTATVRAFGLLAIPALGLATFGWHAREASQVSSGGRAAFLVVALLLGGLATLAQARFTVGFGARAASAAAEARARGSARTLRPLLRAAVAIAVCGEGLGLLGLSLLFGGLYAVRGGFASAQPSVQLAADIAELLPAFALGAAVTALCLSRAGSVAGAAARVGGARSSEPEAGLSGSDHRDPALLAQLMGQLVGELLPSALTSFVCGVVATTSVTLLLLTSPATGALASLGLVVLVRAFGGVASVCGVLAARVTTDEPAARALVRGQGSAALVALFGQGAALFWLMRDEWGVLFVAGAAGLASTTLVALFSFFWLRRPAITPEARPANDASFIARGLAVGFSSAWPSVLVPAVALVSVERALASHTSPWALFVSFVAGVLSLTPYAAAMHGFGVLAAHSRGVVTLSRVELEPGPRATNLEDAATLARAAGGTYASVALGASLLLGLAAIASPAGKGSSAQGLGLGTLAVTLGLGLLTVLGAGAARSAVGGARLVAAEVERQRRSATPEVAPSYKACVDAALAAARAVSALELGAVLLCPFLLAALLRWAGVSDGDAHFPTFGAAAVTAGLIFTLGSRATRAKLGDRRPTPRGNETLTSAQAEAFGDLVGVPVAASVEALAVVLALIVLCLAPLSR